MPNRTPPSSARPSAHSCDPSPAWWLEGGTEECPHCGQPYHLEAERRCAACDAPGCAHCLPEREPHCPSCASEAPE